MEIEETECMIFLFLKHEMGFCAFLLRHGRFKRICDHGI